VTLDRICNARCALHLLGGSWTRPNKCVTGSRYVATGDAMLGGQLRCIAWSEAKCADRAIAYIPPGIPCATPPPGGSPARGPPGAPGAPGAPAGNFPGNFRAPRAPRGGPPGAPGGPPGAPRAPLRDPLFGPIFGPIILLFVLETPSQGGTRPGALLGPPGGAPPGGPPGPPGGKKVHIFLGI